MGSLSGKVLFLVDLHVGEVQSDQLRGDIVEDRIVDLNFGKHVALGKLHDVLWRLKLVEAILGNRTSDVQRFGKLVIP